MKKKYDTGVVFGCWDLLHAGHMLFLRGCMDSCEKLIIGLHTDPSIERTIKNAPVQTLFERYLQLDLFRRDDDQIIPYDIEADITDIIQSYDINVRFLGSDYEDTEFTAKQLLPVVYIPRDHTFSSSELRARIYAAEVAKTL